MQLILFAEYHSFILGSEQKTLMCSYRKYLFRVFPLAHTQKIQLVALEESQVCHIGGLLPAGAVWIPLYLGHNFSVTLHSLFRNSKFTL